MDVFDTGDSVYSDEDEETIDTDDENEGINENNVNNGDEKIDE